MQVWQFQTVLTAIKDSQLNSWKADNDNKKCNIKRRRVVATFITSLKLKCSYKLKCHPHEYFSTEELVIQSQNLFVGNYDVSLVSWYFFESFWTTSSESSLVWVQFVQLHPRFQRKIILLLRICTQSSIEEIFFR